MEPCICIYIYIFSLKSDLKDLKLSSQLQPLAVAELKLFLSQNSKIEPTDTASMDSSYDENITDLKSPVFTSLTDNMSGSSKSKF